MICGALLIGMIVLGVGVVPFFDCPGCVDWCKQVKAPFRACPECEVCGGRGRVSLLKKDSTERERERLKARGLLGP
jgi:hypothetical protein